MSFGEEHRTGDGSGLEQLNRGERPIAAREADARSALNAGMDAILNLMFSTLSFFAKTTALDA
ncbi:hypothetical protein [Glutamicibacter arilaitensis]|uniref:hypothetical protein n=1 Tax=Glutamicibacter arilaitensis TaxID=256701 RepID=UPI003A8DCDD6